MSRHRKQKTIMMWLCLRRSYLVVSLGWLCLLMLPRPVRAQAVASEPPLELRSPDAQRSYAAGHAAMTQGQLDAAQSAIEKAYGIESHPALLLLLGRIAERQSGSSEARLRAADLYRRYLHETKTEAAPPPEVQQFLAAAQPPSAEIVVYGSEEGLLCIDSRLVGTLRSGWAHRVSPGRHRLSLGCARSLASVDAEAAAELPVLVELYPGREPTVRRTVPVIASFDGGVTPPADLAPLVAALREELLRSRHHLLSAEGIQKELAGFPPDCLKDPTCGLRIAHKLKARFWFVISAAPSDGRTWRAKVLHAEAGQACSGEVPLCRICDQPGARASVAGLVAQAQECRVGKVRLHTSPAGARVFVDEAASMAGTTPCELTLLTGTRRLLVRKPGFLPWREQVSIEPEQMAMVPMPIVLAINEPARRRDRFRAGAWTLGALGLLAVAGGSVALALNGRIERDLYEPGGEMPSGRERFTSWQAGTVALSGGLLLLAGSGLLGWRARTEARRAAAAER